MSKIKSVTESKGKFENLLKSGKCAICHIYDDNNDLYVLYDSEKVNMEKMEDMLLLHILGLDSEDK